MYSLYMFIRVIVYAPTTQVSNYYCNLLYMHPQHRFQIPRIHLARLLPLRFACPLPRQQAPRTSPRCRRAPTNASCPAMITQVSLRLDTIALSCCRAACSLQFLCVPSPRLWWRRPRCTDQGRQGRQGGENRGQVRDAGSGLQSQIVWWQYQNGHETLV